MKGNIPGPETAVGSEGRRGIPPEVKIRKPGKVEARIPHPQVLNGFGTLTLVPPPVGIKGVIVEKTRFQKPPFPDPEGEGKVRFLGKEDEGIVARAEGGSQGGEIQPPVDAETALPETGNEEGYLAVPQIKGDQFRTGFAGDLVFQGIHIQKGGLAGRRFGIFSGDGGGGGLLAMDGGYKGQKQG
jgi:hypothetical protein